MTATADSQSRRIFDAQDARRLARRRLPRTVFDFVDGATGREVAAARNEAAFDRIELQPRVMADVARRSLATRFLDEDHDLPFGVAPMGMCALARRGADAMLARAARDFGAPLCISTAASSKVEEMTEQAGGRAWFQLYVMSGAEPALVVADRAWAAGCRTLALTVDTPQVSRRARDLRNGLTAPFHLTPANFLDFALHPGWSLPMLVDGAPAPCNLPEGDGFDRGASRAGADWEFLARLRDRWPGRLVVKGVTHPGDAQRIRDAGADAVWVSNHGGRQLDAAPPAISVLPKIRAAVGPGYPLIFDSGVRSGEDVARALALGADFVMIGRPWLYAIGAEGERGLRALFRIFSEELSLTLAQIGLNDVADLTRAVLVDTSRPAPDASVKVRVAAGGPPP